MSDDQVDPDYWIRWQVFVCALITVSPGIVAAIVISKGREGKLRSSDLWIPCWRNLHPVWILAYRGLVVLLMSVLLLQMLYIDGAMAFYFYTQWTFTLVIIYFGIGTVISAQGCWRIYSEQGARDDEEANGFLPMKLIYRAALVKEMSEKKAGSWGYAMQIIYQTCAGAVILTDIVFWGILAPFLASEHFKVNLIMGCMHSLNAVFLIVDTALNSLPFPWFRMSYFVLWSCIYVIFQWILHACGFAWWPYPFLELSTPWAPAWYIAMAMVHIPCYLIYWLIVKAKNSFFPKWFPHAYISY